MSLLASSSVAPHRDDQPILVLQLTDCHLGATPTTIREVDTDLSLRAVLKLIARNHGHAHLLLVTGDLSHDGSEPSYQRFAKATATLNMPVRCLPGNHDDVATMARIIGPWSEAVTDLGGWRIILLNSCVAGARAGHLNPDQFAHLDEALNSSDGRPTLVALHHHALPLTTTQRGPVMLDNAPELFSHLVWHHNIRVLLWGHIHHAFDRRRGNIRMLATPSTGYQYTSPRRLPYLEELPPGYRWLKLYPDGSVTTAVQRLHPNWRQTLCD